MKTKLPTPQKLPSGMYRCQVTVDGERISVVDADPDICQAKAVEIKAGLARKKEQAKRMTVKMAIEQYIAGRSNVLSPATIRGYKSIHKNYMQDIKGKQVADITEQEIQKKINDLSKSLSYKTVKNAVALLIAVVSCDHPINVKRLKFPARIREEHAYLEGPDIAKLIDACKGDRAEIPILMALWLGMRRSEICALDWEDIDLTGKTLKITKALVPDEKNKYIVKETTKTEKSRRTLDLPDYLISRLMAAQPDEGKRVGRIVRMNPNDIYDRLKIICARSGIPFVGVHGLRHTNASVMLSLGVADKVAMARGGWASKDTMQDIYQHLFSADRANADKAINNYFADLLSKTAHENAHEEIESTGAQTV